MTNPFQDYFPSSLNDFIHSQNMAISVWKRYPLVKTSTHDLCTFQTTQATPSTLSPNLLRWFSSPPPWRTRTSGSSLMGSTSRRRPPLSRMKSRWKVVGGHKSSDFRFSKLVVALCLDGEINPLGNIWVLRIASIPYMLLRIYGGQKSVPCDLCFFSDVPSSHMMGKAQLFLDLWLSGNIWDESFLLLFVITCTSMTIKNQSLQFRNFGCWLEAVNDELKCTIVCMNEKWIVNEWNWSFSRIWWRGSWPRYHVLVPSALPNCE